MKKQFLLFVCALCAFSFSVFAKSSSSKKASNHDDFETVYDDVTDATRITHSDMELSYMMYNLKNSLSGERENIRLLIINGWLAMAADYQNSNWLFIDSVVFLDGKGGRLKIADGKQNGEVNKIGNTFIRERYTALLKDDMASALYDILQAEKPTVSFIGSKGRTDKLVIKPKVKAAMIATIEKWQSLQNE